MSHTVGRGFQGRKSIPRRGLNRSLPKLVDLSIGSVLVHGSDKGAPEKDAGREDSLERDAVLRDMFITRFPYQSNVARVCRLKPP